MKAREKDRPVVLGALAGIFAAWMALMCYMLPAVDLARRRGEEVQSPPGIVLLALGIGMVAGMTLAIAIGGRPFRRTIRGVFLGCLVGTVLTGICTWIIGPLYGEPIRTGYAPFPVISRICIWSTATLVCSVIGAILGWRREAKPRPLTNWSDEL